MTPTAIPRSSVTAFSNVTRHSEHGCSENCVRLTDEPDDPAGELRKIECPSGYKYPEWMHGEFEFATAYAPLPSASVVWNHDGSVLYCILVRQHPKPNTLPDCFLARVRL